jgi:hypothetical protein
LFGRLVVVALVVLTAVAAADAVRGGGSARVVAGPAPRHGVARPTLHAWGAHEYAAAADGRLTRTRVVRRGEEILSSDQIDSAFRVPFEEGGTFDVADLAVAPDGTIAVALYEFPSAGSVHSGVELWQGDRLLASFEVAPGSFSGGIAFTDDGALLATFGRTHRETALYDRRGRQAAGVPAQP